MDGAMQAVELDEARLLLIGRIPEAHVRIPDSFHFVSRLHASLQLKRSPQPQTAATWELIDHHTDNGTFVNGLKVESTRLQDGDLIVSGPLPQSNLTACSWRFQASTPSRAALVPELLPACSNVSKRRRADDEPHAAATLAAGPLQPLIIPRVALAGEAEAARLAHDAAKDAEARLCTAGVSEEALPNPTAHMRRAGLCTRRHTLRQADAAAR